MQPGYRSSCWARGLAAAAGFSFALACGDGGSGGNDGPEACINGEFCVGDLVCVEGLCVPPSTTGAEDPTSEATTDPSTTDDPSGTETADTSTTDPTTTDTAGMDVPVGEACSQFFSNCPPDQKCVPYIDGDGADWNAMHCMPITGSQQLYEPCDFSDASQGIEDCDEGLLCWWDVQDASGMCLAMCGGSLFSPTCDDPAQCHGFNEDTFHMCLAHCDPITQDFCINGDGCYWDSQINLFTCYETGDIPTNSPCMSSNECAPGHTCLGPNAFVDCAGEQGCCAPHCDLSNPDCLPGTQCEAWFVDPPSNLPNLGICVVSG